MEILVGLCMIHNKSFWHPLKTHIINISTLGKRSAIILIFWARTNFLKRAGKVISAEPCTQEPILL
jgi:hypothetical protein